MGFFVKMEELKALRNKLKAFDTDVILQKIWDMSEVQQFIIALITEGEPTSQLYEKGEDGDGTFLGFYEPFSIEVKLGGDGDKRIDHITLKDKGNFYGSYEVNSFKKGFDVTANPITDDGTDLFDRFGEGITKLNEENTKILLRFIEPLFNLEAEKALS